MLFEEKIIFNLFNLTNDNKDKSFAEKSPI